VQYVEINHPPVTLCLAGYGASAVASKLHGRLSISGIAALLENYSVKPFGSSEGDRSDVEGGIC
jgi:hypothetical protein